VLESTQGCSRTKQVVNITIKLTSNQTVAGLTTCQIKLSDFKVIATCKCPLAGGNTVARDGATVKASNTTANLVITQTNTDRTICVAQCSSPGLSVRLDL